MSVSRAKFHSSRKLVRLVVSSQREIFLKREEKFMFIMTVVYGLYTSSAAVRRKSLKKGWETVLDKRARLSQFLSREYLEKEAENHIKGMVYQATTMMARRIALKNDNASVSGGEVPQDSLSGLLQYKIGTELTVKKRDIKKISDLLQDELRRYAKVTRRYEWERIYLAGSGICMDIKASVFKSPVILTK